MSTKRIGIAVITAAALFAVARAQDTKPPAQPPVVGRYQLSSVEHYVIFGDKAPPAGASGDKAVLRIDTATGVVDQWITGADASGIQYDRWVRTGTK